MTPGDAEKLQRITSHIAIYLGVNGSVATRTESRKRRIRYNYEH